MEVIGKLMAGNNGGGTWVFMGEKMKKGSGGS